MYNYRKIQNDLYWVGANDRRLAMFEGVYSVPRGVSYNSYLLLDEKTVLFDTVDRAVEKTFLENVAYGLGGRRLDYVVVHHMEPDHSASIVCFAEKYPDACVLLIDTYNVLKSGVPNAIKVFNDVLAPLGKRPVGVRIDSGDITYLSKKIRKIFV